MTNTRKTTTITQYSLILIFLLGIWLPIFGYVLGAGDSNELGEKRNLAPLPKLGIDSLDTIPDKFDAYYEDHFGFRIQFVRGYNYIRYKLLKGASVGKVLIGENDWLYLTEDGIIADYIGHKQLTQEQLNQWKQGLEAYESFLAERGIRLLFVIAPNKAMIYPENLPEHIYSNKGRTRMDQLVEYLNENSHVEFLDLRPALWQAKKHDLVYYPHDTHWNHRGSFIAYTEICKRLAKWFPGFQPWRLDDFDTKEEIIIGDLSVMLGLSKTLAQKCEVFQPNNPRNATRTTLTLPANYPWPRHIQPDQQVSMENPNAEIKSILFHDSFGDHGGFKEYLAEHFRKISFVSTYPDIECLRLVVEQEKPDLVIIQTVERELDTPPAFN